MRFAAIFLHGACQLVLSGGGLLSIDAFAAEASDPHAPVPPVSYSSPYQDFRAADTSAKPWLKADTPVLAAEQNHAHQHPADAAAAAAAAMDGEGTILAIAADRRTIKLKHGAIAKIDMPPMTMSYKLKSPELAKDLKTGDNVGFSVEEQDGDYVITGLQRREP